MIKIGLTGSMGMGKTTTAGVFVKYGCALWDADKTVHKLYSKGGIAVDAVSELFPKSVENGSISRTKLKVLLKEQPEKLKQLEKIVHPLIKADRQNFQNQNIAAIAVFDVPLLCETGVDKEMDKTVCVFTSAKNQIERLKKRADIGDNYYEKLISKQMPSEEKCKLSDFTIETTSHEMVEEKVLEILNILRA